jgi:hypothetical protein
MCADDTYGVPTTGLGISLCCQQEQPKVAEGDCRTCSSCGGAYNYTAGATTLDNNWPNWSKVYDTSCTGQPANRDATNGHSICCKSDPICVLCSSCGGTHPEENGAFAYDSNWPTFFSYKGSQCTGALGHTPLTIPGGVKLCCKN